MIPHMQNPGRRIVPISRGPCVSDAELAALRDHALHRRRKSAMAWIASQIDALESLDSPEAIWLLAQWADDPSVARFGARLCARFSGAERARMPLSAYVYLRLAEETCQGEVSELTRALAAEVDLELFSSVASPELAAVNAAKDALRDNSAELLNKARAELQRTQDWVWLGRVEAALGRIALEGGQYEQAAEYFAAAEHQFAESREPHADWAQCLSDWANAERLLAARLVRNIDVAVKARRRAQRNAASPASDSAVRARIDALHSSAARRAIEAGRMFGALGDCHGETLARIELGELRANCGDLDAAAEDARGAFEAGALAQDSFAMAHARLLLSRVELARFEEGIGSDPVAHAQRAHDFAADALRFATNVDPQISRRLLARIHVHRGTILAGESFTNLEQAREECRRAGELLRPSDRDQLYDDHQALSARVLHAGCVEAQLKRWSLGMIDDRTFQQITEEFAELVIPRVWAREGRNVSRVVARLSISPKKVRRILTRSGVKT
jgi:hypothetical protein